MRMTKPLQDWVIWRLYNVREIDLTCFLKGNFPKLNCDPAGLVNVGVMLCEPSNLEWKSAIAYRRRCA
jgi:hypothetical protein